MGCKHDWELIDKTERKSPLYELMSTGGEIERAHPDMFFITIIYLFKCTRCKEVKFEEKQIGRGK